MSHEFEGLNGKMCDFGGVKRNASKILRKGDLVKLNFVTGFSYAHQKNDCVDYFLVKSIDSEILKGESLDLQRSPHRDTINTISYPEGHEINHNKVFLNSIEIIARDIDPESSLIYLLRSLFFERKNLRRFRRSVRKVVGQEL